MNTTRCKNYTIHYPLEVCDVGSVQGHEVNKRERKGAPVVTTSVESLIAPIHRNMPYSNSANPCIKPPLFSNEGDFEAGLQQKSYSLLIVKTGYYEWRVVF